MRRVLFFIISIVIPIIFGWWFFIPLALLYVFLAKFPYELIMVAFVLDSVYYFGSGLIWTYPLTIFSVILLVIAFFLNKTIHWNKVI